LFSQAAYGSSVSLDSPNVGQPVSAESPPEFVLYFGHNVAHSDLFPGNSALISMRDEAGNNVEIAVNRKFFGTTPGGDNPDFEGYRRYIYVQPPRLKPATTYTLIVQPGIRSEGGHVYGGLTITFTTGGEPLPPEPPPEPPKPDPPPKDNKKPAEGAQTGGGGSGGQGGSATHGGGADDNLQGSNNDTGNTNASSNTADVSLAATESVIIESGSSVPASSSRAAGEGGGTVYIIGELGLPPGTDIAKQVAEIVLPSIEKAVSFLAIAVGIIVFAMIRRIILWRRRLTNPTDKTEAMN